jgi:hypothetical protein
MPGEIVKLPNQGLPKNLGAVEGVSPHKWIGRIITVELSTGRRVQGKILSLNEQWMDTDNGGFRVSDIVFAKWVGQEEEQIIRGGPLGSSYDPYQLPRRR